MISINKKVFSRIVTLGVIVIFLWYFFSNIDDFKLLLGIKPIFVILLIIINILSIIINGIFMKWSISLFDKNININESIRVSLISSAGNFFAPAGSGLGFRAVYLKKRHSLSYSDYTSILFCNYVIVFFVSSIIGLVSLYLLRSHASAGFNVLIIFFACLFLASFSALFIRTKPSTRDYKQKWVKFIVSVIERISIGWRLIFSNKKIMVGLTSLVVVSSGLMVLSTYFIMSAINLNLSIASLLLFSVLGSVSVFINITPGNLGVKEAVYIAFSALIGLSTPQILSAALVDRSVLFFVLFLLWTIYGRKFHSTMNAKTD